MKICLISREYPPETGFGGIGTYTYHLAHGLTKKGHAVSVITQALESERIYKDKKVKVYRIKDQKVPFRGLTRISNLLTNKWFSYYWHSRSVFKKINKIIEKEGSFDIIEGPLWDGETLAYNPEVKAPLIVRLQTPIFKSLEILNKKPNKTLELIEKSCLEKATLIPSISKNVGEIVSKKYQVPETKIKVNYLGISLPKINKPKFKENSHKLLYVGRLEVRKGTLEFIDSINEILENNPKIIIDIVGKDIPQAPGDIYFKDYFKTVVKKTLQKRVKFQGFVSDINLKKFYKSCDVLIAPSRYESFGLIYLEAFAYGKPVIGTNTGAIPEIVKHNKTGLLVEVDNPKSIARAVLKIFNDNDFRKKLGENAFKDIRQNMTLQKMVDKTLDIYNEAIKIYKGQNNG
jgi:glycosyltransferase involved in cell wall biosynthesis